MIYIGADHGGFELKEYIKKFLKKELISFQELGANISDSSDDYPLIAEKVARAVGKKKNALGIILCKSGQGVCIAANKIHGIRAALCWNTASAKSSRNDDNANILCLPAQFLTPQQTISIIKKWLATPFSKEPRHKRRVAQIIKIERENT